MLGKWEVPIYNDTYVMLFFGFLKKLVSKWLIEDADKVWREGGRRRLVLYLYICTCKIKWDDGKVMTEL